MRSCLAIPPADRPRTSCSTSATFSSRPCVCCCRAIHAGSECCLPNGVSQRCFWSSQSSHSRSVRPFSSSRPLNLPAWWRRAPAPRAAPFSPITLVGTHGVHVASGLIALVYLVAQVLVKGFRAAVLRRLLCWSLFWHALDIVWVGVFTLVYLMGGHS